MRHSSRSRIAAATIGILLGLPGGGGGGDSGAADAQVKDRGGGAKRPDVIFVPTPWDVVDKMLELAEIREGDVLYDLGCGDGRIVVEAAKRHGIRAVGFDIDPKRVRESLENVQRNGVAGLVTIRQADLFAQDLRGASVVTLYLLPNLNARLLPQLETLKPGARVVSHSFPIKGLKPRQVAKLRYERGGVRTVYKYVVPFEKLEGEPLSPKSSSPSRGDNGSGDNPR